MSILKDVLSELLKMFVSDAGLTAAILVEVVIAAVLIGATAFPALVGGAMLLGGCLAVLVLSVQREARRRARMSAGSADAFHANERALAATIKP